jgi:hypothetical protein
MVVSRDFSGRTLGEKEEKQSYRRVGASLQKAA